jgi:hypothetical protein
MEEKVQGTRGNQWQAQTLPRRLGLGRHRVELVTKEVDRNYEEKCLVKFKEKVEEWRWRWK